MLIELPKECKIINFKITEASPKEIDIVGKITSPNVLAIKPMLLNSGDSFTVNTLSIDCNISLSLAADLRTFINLNARISGVNRIEKSAPINQNPLINIGNLRAISIIFLIGVAYFIFNFDWRKKSRLAQISSSLLLAAYPGLNLFLAYAHF